MLPWARLAQPGRPANALYALARANARRRNEPRRPAASGPVSLTASPGRRGHDQLGFPRLLSVRRWRSPRPGRAWFRGEGYFVGVGEDVEQHGAGVAQCRTDRFVEVGAVLHADCVHTCCSRDRGDVDIGELGAELGEAGLSCSSLTMPRRPLLKTMRRTGSSWVTAMTVAHQHRESAVTAEGDDLVGAVQRLRAECLGHGVRHRSEVVGPSSRLQPRIVTNRDTQTVAMPVSLVKIACSEACLSTAIATASGGSAGRDSRTRCGLSRPGRGCRTPGR